MNGGADSDFFVILSLSLHVLYARDLPARGGLPGRGGKLRFLSTVCARRAAGVNQVQDKLSPASRIHTDRSHRCWSDLWEFRSRRHRLLVAPLAPPLLLLCCGESRCCSSVGWKNATTMMAMRILKIRRAHGCSHGTRAHASQGVQATSWLRQSERALYGRGADLSFFLFQPATPISVNLLSVCVQSVGGRMACGNE